MTHGWTGGQYSVVRVVLAGVLATMLVALAWPEDVAVRVVAGLGVVLCVPLTLGWRDKAAAGGLLAVWFALGLLMLELPLVGGPGQVWWLMVVALVAHLSVPGRPYGALDAVGRSDPAGDWRMPGGVWVALWVFLSIHYLGRGVWMLQDEAWRLGTALDLQAYGWLPEAIARGLTWALLGAWLAFAPLALLRSTRPIGWTLALAADVVVLPLAGYPLTAAALAVLHLLAFVPDWLPASRGATETLFYDGHCGLCHRSVRFILAEDRTATRFDFAPLQGEAFRQQVPAAQRQGLPDTVVLQRADGVLLVRSGAVLHVLNALGGLWRVIAWAGRLVPRKLRDAAYEGVSKVRHRLFATPPDVCPRATAAQQARLRC